MYVTSLVRAAVLPLAAVCITGCFPFLLCPRPPLRQGLGVTAAGALAAGEHGSHTLSLTPGAQNDVYVTPRDSAHTATTYTIYVTSATCTAFSPDAPNWELRYPVIPQDPCAIISRDTLTQRTLILGRTRFGADARVMVREHEVSGADQFRLWIIGDPRMPISYDVAIRWTSGHDC